MVKLLCMARRSYRGEGWGGLSTRDKKTQINKVVGWFGIVFHMVASLLTTYRGFKVLLIPFVFWPLLIHLSVTVRVRVRVYGDRS